MLRAPTHEAEAILAQVLDLKEADRLTALRQFCAGDAELASEIQSLLEAIPGADAFFAQFPSECDDNDSAFEGRRVGAYRIVSELGRGGMGAVYRAERDDGEFVRDVAIKFMSVLLA